MSTPQEVETQLKRVRMLAMAISVMCGRFVLDPKGALLQMVKNKELFQDDKDERVVVAREGMRWSGILLLCICLKVISLAKVDPSSGTLSESAREALRVLGYGLFFDGLIVKWFGFWRSGAFTFVDSTGVGLFDMSMGLYLLFKLP